MYLNIIQGDSLEILETFQDNSFDSLVTDPPAGISFLNEDWDNHKGGRLEWITWLASVLSECKRVLKPGAHGLVWVLPRTSHWTMTACEEAGFEIRDVVTHVFGSGFPKSQDVGKKLEDWQGFGTALKPSCEFWVLIRKPFDCKTIVENVLKWGVGAIDIDGCRIKADDNIDRPTGTSAMFGTCKERINTNDNTSKGRWPANFILSHNIDCECKGDNCTPGCPVDELGKQSGWILSSFRKTRTNHVPIPFSHKTNIPIGDSGIADEGTSARYFYQAKPSPTEKNKGCEDYEFERNGYQLKGNPHPTVKSIGLMKYLIKLVTPKKGMKVLDPFAGSGTTGIAAMQLDMNYTLIDQCEEFCKIAEMRIKAFEVEKEKTLFNFPPQKEAISVQSEEK